MSKRSDGGQTEQPEWKQGRSTSDHAVLESEQGLSIGQIVRMLLRHKLFILVCTLVCALAAFIYDKTATPIYEASATIRVDEGRASSLGLSDLTGGSGPSGPDVLATEIQVLQSDQVVIAALDSLPDDVFRRYAGEDKKALLIPAHTEVLTPEQEDLISDFKGVLGVKQVPETQLIELTFRGPDPKLAATLLNHLVAAYLRQSFDNRYNSVSQVTEWLSAQMQQLKERAADAQQKLAAFQERNNIVGTADSNITTDRLRILNERLAAAEGDRIVKEAQLRAATATSDPAVLASLVSNSKLQALQSDQATLYSQYAQLSTKFGQNYTPLVQLKKQMQAIDAEINREAQSSRERLQEDYDASKRGEDMLRGEYQNQVDKAYAFNREQADFSVLQAEGGASRQLYNTLQYKLEQAGIDAGLSGVNTMTLDTARAPLYPVEPKKTIILAFGAILGLLIGVGSAFIVEASADKVSRLEQVAGAVGYRPLVTIPRVSVKRLQGIPPAAVALRQPLSREAEPYRRLRNMLLQSTGTGSLRSFMITSAESAEGKSTVSANLAVVLAQTGANVLLVDAELRRPSLAEQFSARNEPGLSDCLVPGAECLGGNIETNFSRPVESLKNLAFLPAGKPLAMPAEALASEKFRSLLALWQSSFDYVVIKAAPVLPVSDSVPLANWVDGVLVIARQNVTRLKNLQQAREILGHTQAHVLGIIVDDATGAAAQYSGKAYGEAAYAS